MKDVYFLTARFMATPLYLEVCIVSSLSAYIWHIKLHIKLHIKPHVGIVFIASVQIYGGKSVHYYRCVNSCVMNVYCKFLANRIYTGMIKSFLLLGESTRWKNVHYRCCVNSADDLYV